MEEEKQTPSILHNLEKNEDMNKLLTKNLLIVLVVVAIFGVGSGYLLAYKGGKVGSPTITKNTSGSVAKGTVEGSDDLKTFKDPAEGTLKEGGIEGEGQFHLVRPGGESQYVYLTSSIIDLSRYTDRKVKVWGQTQKAEKAGWLMDVGRVEVLE